MSFYEEIYTAIKISTLYPKLTGGFWRGFVDSETFPFMRYDVNYDEPDEFADDDNLIQIVSCFFHCFALTDFQTKELLDEIETLFVKGESLEWTGGHTISANLGSGSSFEEDPDRDEQGNLVWHGIRVIDFKIQRKVGT